MKKDMVVGAITGYGWPQIAPWVNSLDRCGFTGTKVLLTYNISYATVEELVNRDYTVFCLGKKNDLLMRYEYPEFSIVVERFRHLWQMLSPHKEQYRYLIHTDVKDVIFQENPSTWLENNIHDNKINVACESITYANEDWGKNNLIKSFGPVIYESYKNNLIFNAGTMSGEFDAMLDFFLNISLLCSGTQHHIEGGGGPDQAAVNILMGMQAYRDSTNFAMSEDGYAAQLGTTGPQMAGKYRKKLAEPSPILVDNVVCTSTGKPFVLVHQYDRTPWREVLEKKYA